MSVDEQQIATRALGKPRGECQSVLRTLAAVDADDDRPGAALSIPSLGLLGGPASLEGVLAW